MWKPLFSALAICTATTGQAATVSYAIDFSDAEGTLSGTFTTDTTDKTLAQFNLTAVIYGTSGPQVTLSFNSASTTLGSGTPGSAADEHYFAAGGRNAAILTYGSGVTSSTVIELDRYVGPIVNPVDIYGNPGSPGAQFAEVLGLAGPYLFAGQASMDISASVCLAKRVAYFDFGFYYTRNAYQPESCNYFTGTVAQTALPGPEGGPDMPAVPLPASLPLILTGFGGLALLRRRR